MARMLDFDGAMRPRRFHIFIFAFAALSVSTARPAHAFALECVSKVTQTAPVSFAPPLSPLTHAVRAFVMDWDDNSVFMPTKIYIFKKGSVGSSGELALTTGQYAAERNNIGVSGIYADYELRFDFDTGSMRDFNKNLFLKQLKEIVGKSKPGDPPPTLGWQGFSWSGLVEGLSTETNAASFVVLTARGQSPDEILEGFKFLQERGFIKYLPRLENIFPVTYPKINEVLAKRFNGFQLPPEAMNDISTAKAMIQMKLADEVQAEKLGPDASLITNQDGTGQAQLHTWGFSDDDYGNFTKAVATFSAAIKANPARWSQVKITIFYSGKSGPVPPQVVVLKSDGDPRPRTPLEAQLGAGSVTPPVDSVLKQ